VSAIKIGGSPFRVGPRLYATDLKKKIREGREGGKTMSSEARERGERRERGETQEGTGGRKEERKLDGKQRERNEAREREEGGGVEEGRRERVSKRVKKGVEG
jgi:hypothetical protein